MEDKLRTAQDAAIGFVRRLRPQDLAQLIDFDSRVDVAQPFTGAAPQLESAIRRTSAGGSTSLHNAIYISLKELKKIRARGTEDIRRQAIIVLSDGEDTSSLVSFDEVLELAKRSETAVYAIGLRSADVYRQRGFSEAEFVLRQLTQQTGGRVFFPKQVSELTGVYAQIADELSSQYTIGYTSRNPKRDGAWRRVIVRLPDSNLTARTKQGYYAPVPVMN
jgi:Ca-activated chloride channel family protein